MVVISEEAVVARNRRVLRARLERGGGEVRVISEVVVKVSWPEWMEGLVEPGWRRFFLERPALLHEFGLVRERLGGRWEAPNSLPPLEWRWTAFNRCPLERIRVVIVGQDPYLHVGQGYGVAFSVMKGVAVPPSLRRVFDCLERTVEGWRRPEHGCLDEWMERGVWLVNMALTVGEGEAGSHSREWSKAMSLLMGEVAKVKKGLAWLLWGREAGKVAAGVGKDGWVLTFAHPSPLSKVDWSVCPHFRILSDEWGMDWSLR
jgi:uracil-DNA glycosylase